MCIDPPFGHPLKRIAVCACGANFPECDLDDADAHITPLSSPNHFWVWVDIDVWEQSALR